MQIALGTAAFGPVPYGATDKRLLQEYEIQAIIHRAMQCGILAFDTAPDYGSEEHLKGLDVKIVTKVPRGKIPEESLRSSLKNLEMTKVHGLLLHAAEDLDVKTFLELQKLRPMVEKIGVSIYSPSEIPKFPIDILQIPLSVLDQRFLPYLEGLKKRGIEIWARSIFAQGVIFLGPEDLLMIKNSRHRGQLARALERFHKYCEEDANAKPHHVSLGFLRSTGCIDYALCGAKTIFEVESITGNFDARHLAMTPDGEWHVLDPRFWE